MQRLRYLSIRSVRRTSISPLQQPRLYSTEARDDGPIRIEVGSSGSITVDLFQPFSPITPSSFIFYLPRGPFPLSSPPTTPEPTDLRPLAEAASAVVARVNYRLAVSDGQRYPTPIYDVANAWQWLFGLRMSQSPGTVGPRYLPPIGVCGELVGGSLATMLALTECHARPLPGITAAYLGNPVTDWTAMPGLEKATTSEDNHDSAKNSRSLKAERKKSGSWLQHSDAPELPSSKILPLRSKLFANPTYWFDSFASPMLFFRTPSQPEPSPTAEQDETFEAVMQTMTDDADAPPTTPPASEDGDAQKPSPQKWRISHRRWPPTRSGLILPHMHMTLGVESPLRDMGVDLAKSVNRSVFLHELDKACELKEVDRATMEDRPGAGVWGPDELVTIGHWFKEAFRYQ